MIQVKKIFLSLLLVSSSCLPGALVETLGAGKKLLPTEAGQKIFTSVIEEKQAKLADLVYEHQQLLETEKQFLTHLNASIDEVISSLNLIKEAALQKPDDEFLRTQRALLDERYQVLNDKRRARERLVAILEQHIKIIQEFLNDPHFTRYTKDLKGQKSGHGQCSFEDLHTINQMIVEQEKGIELLREQEKNAHVELENRKKTAAATADSVPAAEEELSSFDDALFVVDEHQRGVIAALTEQLNADQKERDALMLEEIEHKKSLIRTELFMAKAHLDVLKGVFQKIKPAVQVSEADVAFAKDELAKKRQQAFDVKESYRREIELVSHEQKEKEQKLTELSKRYSYQLGPDLDDWSRDPVKTIAGHLRYLECAELNDNVLYLARKKDLLEAQLAFEDEKLQLEHVHIAVKESFYKIIACKFSSDDEIKQEKKKYVAPKAETKANLSLIRERRSIAQNLLDQQKRALENLTAKRRKIQDQRNSIFRGNSKEHTRCIELLNSAQERIQQQIEMLNKLTNIYADMISMFKKTNKQIEFIRSELESISIWYRPEFAISWHGIAQIVPTTLSFFNDLRAYIVHARGDALIDYGSRLATNPWQLVKVLLFVVAMITLVVGLRHLLPLFVLGLRSVAMRLPRARWFILFVLACVQWIATYFGACMVWFIAWLSLHYADLADPYPYILFALISIPYLVVLARRFIAFMAHFNMVNGYALWRPEFQQRFLTVVASLLYATISITLFRHAFILGSYHKSELPTILLALNITLVQIAIVMLITKDHVLALIPRSHAIGQWIAAKVEQFYYIIVLMVMVIMVLSNPYIGFGKLVLFILSRFMYMALALPILYWLHQTLKRGASHLFFYADDGVMRERFEYAKTSYGLFMVALFLSFTILGVILVAKMWGWPDTFAQMNHWRDFVNWLKNPILLATTENPISMFSLIKIMSFIVAGFALAYAINRFILGRIFDVLLVEPGVQNTVTSLTRYLILITTLILGFQAVGLDALVWYLIGALIVGIGWVIKDPIGDVIAYFIILVQRPIKIGDYITLDEENKGVVRKITPRSVVIRRKNSTTIIVPNSTVIRKPLANWNYARGFTAFDDIMVTVTFQTDPTIVKGLLEKVLDASPFVLKSPKPVVRLENFSDYGFVFLVRGYLSSNYTLDQWDIASDIRLDIVKVLRQQNIELAMPMRIVVNAQGKTIEMTEEK